MIYENIMELEKDVRDLLYNRLGDDIINYIETFMPVLNRFPDIEKMCRASKISNSLCYVRKWTVRFGKYEGKRFEDLPDKYINWLIKKNVVNGKVYDYLKSSIESKYLFEKHKEYRKLKRKLRRQRGHNRSYILDYDESDED